MAELIYGLKDDKLIHINDVEQGLKCGCVCPNCGENLIARKGKINEHHFAHESKECDITIAQETVLHLMAKEIFSEAKTIKLPKVIIDDKFAFLGRDKHKNIKQYDNLIYKKLEKYKDSTKVIDNVIIEKYIDNIKPDVVLEIEGKKLIIEIAVTHFIDNKKKDKIIELGIPTIEIDLSSYKKTINNLTKENLTQILIADDKYKYWIYYNNYLKDINDLIVKNNTIIDKLDWLSKYYKQNFSQEYRFCYDYNNLNEKHFKNYWDKFPISKKVLTPWFINIPIEGDILFNVDRRIWQIMIFNKIYNYKNISLNYITNYIKSKKIIRYPDYNVWGEDCVYDIDGLELIESKLIDVRTLTNSNKTIEEVLKNYYEILQEHKIIDYNGKYIYGLY